MKAVIFGPGVLPHYGVFPDPIEGPAHRDVEVVAAALTNLDVGIATGRHYLSPPHGTAVVGREGVVRLPGGERLFLGVGAIPVPYGSMAERVSAEVGRGLRVVDELDDERAAALGNAGLAAWLPLSWRARLERGETVLVIGATGITGRIAVAAARRLGAGRVVAAGRDPASLDRLLSSGADAVVRLDDTHDLTAAYREAARGDVHVVLDYLNGPPAEAALPAMATGARMVQIGSALAPAMALHAQTARRACLDVLGFAYYHAPLDAQQDAYTSVCLAAVAGDVTIPVVTLPLERFDEAWQAQCAGSASRFVLRP